MDRLCRYEDLDAELAAVWDRLGLPGAPDLPRAKAHARPARAHYRDLFDDTSADRVRRVFADTLADVPYDF